MLTQAPAVALEHREHPSTSHDTRRNATIEGLRGFSALIVILFHIHNMAVNGKFFTEFSDPLVRTEVGKLGLFGVALFFIISGYLIIQSLVKHADVRRFLYNRFTRIYPVFLFLHLIMFTLGPLGNYEWMGYLKHHPRAYVTHFLSNLFMLPGLFRLPIAQKNAWSLSYEFAFYFLSCLCYVGLRGRERNKLTGNLMFLLGLGVSGTALYLHPNAWFFVVGVLIYLTVDRLNQRRDYRPLPAWSGLLSLALAYAFFPPVPPEQGVLPVLPAYFPNALALSLLFGFVFFLTVVNQEGVFSALLRTPPLQYLGKISYSLYLIHPFALMPLRAVMRRVAPHLHSQYLAILVFGCCGLALAVFVATLSYRYIEVGFTNRYLKKRSGSRNAEAVVIDSTARPAGERISS